MDHNKLDQGHTTNLIDLLCNDSEFLRFGIIPKKTEPEQGHRVNLSDLLCDDKEITEHQPFIIDQSMSLKFSEFLRFGVIPKNTEPEQGHRVNLSDLLCDDSEFLRFGVIPKNTELEQGHRVNLSDLLCDDKEITEHQPTTIDISRMPETIPDLHGFYNLIPIETELVQGHQLRSKTLYNDNQNVHTSSIHQSIITSIKNLLKDTY
jgi:hypothetical protein